QSDPKQSDPKQSDPKQSEFSSGGRMERGSMSSTPDRIKKRIKKAALIGRLVESHLSVLSSVGYRTFF
ncbi:MAG: hypothetical protein VX111_11815, partial [Planctomycetota bacterium]|nr:hypothetical protein [Planctomycetota bacterium]